MFLSTLSFTLSALLLVFSSAAAAATSWIVPGAVWTSTAGAKIDAHGGMVLRNGDVWYWVGYSAGHNIAPYMYSSKDLLNWTPAANPVAGIGQLWRPKLARGSGKWWIYGQVDRNVQALVSNNIDSGYATKGAKVTLPPNGYTYSDTGMFMDDDQTWYLLTSADHNNVQINKINSDGSIGARVNVLAKGAYEAPGLFKANGTYFLIVSGKTGYRANPNSMFWASSLTGTWNGPYGIAPDSEKTYNSQNTFELTVQGSKTTTYIYMGDSWDSKGGADSNYVWLPMTVDAAGKKVSLQYHAQWKIDVVTGEVSVPTLKTRYEAEHAELSGRAAAADCAHCLNRRGVHAFVDEDAKVTFRNVTGLGGKQWVQFHYRVVGEREGVEVGVRVNGGSWVDISRLNHRAGFHDVVPIELDLEAGAGNRIEFAVRGGEERRVVLDGIEVVED